VKRREGRAKKERERGRKKREEEGKEYGVEPSECLIGA